MYVTQSDFFDTVKTLSKEKVLGFDCETTGLRWFSGDRLFSLQFSTARQAYYFDFNTGGLPRDLLKIIDKEIFSDPTKLFFIGNAKFDMHMLAREGIEIAGTIHCTQAISKVINNNELKCGLDALATKYIGGAKLDVKTFIKDNGLFTKVAKLGNPDRGFEERLHYDKVPLNLMVPYAEEDALIVYDLGIWQLNKIIELERKYFDNAQTTWKNLSIWNVVHQERQLTKTAFAMEERGIKIDRAYCERAYEYEINAYKECQRELDKIYGEPLDTQSGIALAKLFDKEKIPAGKTDKGNDSFNKTVLEAIDHPVCNLILKFRSHYKRAHTYYENFLWLSDKNDILHANMNQGGAKTGRVSYFEPNLQNLPKRAEKKSFDMDETGNPYPIRRAFVPRPGFFLASLDCDQMEYRMMLDYAGEMGVIAEVLAGMDVHTATAKLMGIDDREAAKTINFMLLYGGGVKKLADGLKKPEWEARALRNKYFRALPNVVHFKNKVIAAAENRGYIFNWLGRIYNYERGIAYKAPNHLIQGGCGDVVKRAMNTAHEHLKDKKSGLSVQIHDELLLEIHNDEKPVVPEVIKIMESSFPQKHLPLTAGAAHSYTSWGELHDGVPT